MSLALSLYRGIGHLAGPVLKPLLRRRIAQGKEDAARQGERFGQAGLPRPAGKLIWIHAASVGESLSALPLIDALRSGHGASVLMTTGTVTSAEMAAARAPGVLHQFVPLDTPGAVARFLDHWRPDLALWIESELWPTLVTRTSETGCPIALVNGRISEKSARNWRMARGMAGAVIGAFDLRLVQSDDVRERFLGLGADPDTTVVTGDLKQSRPVDAPDPGALDAMRAALAGRPVWLAASTHPGEEEAVAAAHGALSARVPDLLTILAPRHPERGGEIAGQLAGAGFTVSRRSAGETPEGLYIADTLGELPLWYTLAPIAFIGGGWGELGGHNPLEAAQAGTAVLSGPRVVNFSETYNALHHAGAVRFVEDARALAVALLSLTDASGAPSGEALRMARAGLEAGAPDSGPLDRTLAALAPLLAKALS